MRNRFSNRRKKSGRSWGSVLLPVALFLLVFALFYAGLADIDRTATQEQLRAAENAVVKAAVQCYALEGQYPPDVRYLREKYGLQVDEEKYIIHYDLAGSNLMPQISVFSREG